MKLAIEPKGIDLVVEPHKYSKSDSELMLKIITHYNSTGELLKFKNLKKKSKTDKEIIPKQ